MTPLFPKKEPEIPNPNLIPKRYAESNKWIWDLNQKLKTKLEQILHPMEDFKNQFE